jgi:hypothetical protein
MHSYTVYKLDISPQEISQDLSFCLCFTSLPHVRERPFNSWIHVSKLQYTKKIAPNKMGGGEYKSKCLTIMDLLIRDRPFNMKGGGYGFLFRSEFVFRTTQELFILSRKARIFSTPC